MKNKTLYIKSGSSFDHLLLVKLFIIILFGSNICWVSETTSNNENILLVALNLLVK